jgi:hypothetical protein
MSSRGSEESIMKKKWMFLLIPPAIVLFLALFGELVMHLWNWLAPALFGWRPVTFWQAIGLLILCRILFGGFGGRGHDRSQWRRPMAERWARMNPEEREKFRQNMRSRCGGFGEPDTGMSEPV